MFLPSTRLLGDLRHLRDGGEDDIWPVSGRQLSQRLEVTRADGETTAALGCLESLADLTEPFMNPRLRRRISMARWSRRWWLGSYLGR